MPRKYPPLSPQEVRAILKELGFTVVASRGSHEKWRRTMDGVERNVTVDLHINPFGDDLMKSMIAQAGVSRDVFYGATKKTAKKI